MKKPDETGLVRTVVIVACALVVTAWTIHDKKYRLCPALLIPACIFYLACARYSRVMSMRQEQGLSTSRLRKAGLFVHSIGTATVMIGISDLAYLTGYHAFLRVLDILFETGHYLPSMQPRGMILGAVSGAVVALWVASGFSKAASSCSGSEPLLRRRWTKLWWPVGLTLCIGAMLLAEHEWDKYAFCSMMAEYHAKAEQKADRPEEASLHVKLKLWYRYSAIRPWLPVHPDEPR